MTFVGICMYNFYKTVACGSMSVFGDPEASHCVVRNNRNVINILGSEYWTSLAIDAEWQKVKNHTSVKDICKIGREAKN